MLTASCERGGGRRRRARERHPPPPGPLPVLSQRPPPCAPPRTARAAAVLAGASGSLLRKERRRSPARAEAVATAPPAPPPLAGLPPALAALLDARASVDPVCPVGPPLAGLARRPPPLRSRRAGPRPRPRPRSWRHRARHRPPGPHPDPGARVRRARGGGQGVGRPRLPGLRRSSASDAHYKGGVPSRPRHPHSASPSPATAGFGAGAFSWGVVVHPARGRRARLAQLTQHAPCWLWPHPRPPARLGAVGGPGFNGRLGAALRDLDPGKRGARDGPPPAPSVDGHSPGAASAAEQAVSGTWGACDALILVAPAIVAGFGRSDRQGPTGRAAPCAASPPSLPPPPRRCSRLVTNPIRPPPDPARVADHRDSPARRGAVCGILGRMGSPQRGLGRPPPPG